MKFYSFTHFSGWDTSQLSLSLWSKPPVATFPYYFSHSQPPPTQHLCTFSAPKGRPSLNMLTAQTHVFLALSRRLDEVGGGDYATDPIWRLRRPFQMPRHDHTHLLSPSPSVLLHPGRRRGHALHARGQPWRYQGKRAEAEVTRRLQNPKQNLAWCA